MRVQALFFLFFFLGAAVVQGQALEGLFQKANAQLILKKKGDLFLHFDRSLYQTGEEMWFAAYLLDDTTPVDSLHTLTVVLVNDMLQSVVSSEKYVLQKGVASGSIYLPDSLQTGEYSVMAYTNLFAQDPSSHPFFRQPVAIVGWKPPFKISFSEAVQTGDSLTLTAKVVKAEGGLPSGALLSYRMYANGLLKQASAKTDAFGEVKIIVAASGATKTLEMAGKIEQEKEQTAFKVPVWWDAKDYIIKLFPESGQLVSGHTGKVFFQLTTTSGKGMAAQLELAEDQKIIQVAESDEYGIGVFAFTPQVGKHYSLAIKDQPTVKIWQHFPAISRNGFAISTAAVSSDTLFLLLTANATNDPAILVIDNSKEIISQLALRLNSGGGSLKLPIKDWPAGIYTVSLFDDKAKLQAQTWFTIKPDTSSVSTTISTDSSFYHERSKLTVKVNVRDKEGKPLRALFSFSSALSKTIQESSADIVRFNWLDRFLPAGNALPSLSFLQASNHLQFFLWQRNAFQQNTDARLLSAYQVSGYDGQVLLFGKPLKKPVELTLVGNELGTITTDGKGYFKLPVLPLRGNKGSRVLVSVKTNDPKYYSILLDSSAERLNHLLAAQYYCLPQFSKRDIATLQQKQEMQQAQGKLLQEVVITAKNTDNNKTYYGAFVGGGCDDYVCMNGILNCPNHPRCCTPAIDGETYLALTGRQLVSVTYRCQGSNNKSSPYIKTLNAIAYKDDFYPVDYGNLNTNYIDPSLLKSDLQYWSPLTLTDAKGEATFSFYTNDHTGKFTAALQGITTQGVITSKAAYEVRE